MAKSDIDVRLRLRDAKRFQRDAKQSGDSIRGFKNEVKGGAAMRQFARNLVGIGAGFGALSKAKQWVNTSTELAKTTIGLTKSFDLDTSTASEWASVAKVRNVQSKQLMQAFGGLSKQQAAAVGGTKASVKAFDDLGIPMDHLKNLGFNDLLSETADGLKALPTAQARTNAGLKLFGKGWQTVLPLIRGGSDAMDENLAMARKYGATFGGKNIKSMEDLIKAEREAQFASLGLSITFGTMVAPALTDVIKKISSAALWFRELPGPVQKGAFAVVGLVASVMMLSAAVSMLGPGASIIGAGAIATLGAGKRAVDLYRTAIATWRLVYIAQTGATNASTLAVLRHMAASRLAAFWTNSITKVTRLWGAAMLFLNGTFLANPVFLIVAGIVALGAAFYLAYKKVEWFRKAVDSTWNFIKKYWPLLIGPLNLLIAPIILLVKNFGKIKKAASSAFKGLLSIWKTVINGIIGIWNSIDFGIHIRVPGWVPEVGGKGFNVNDIFPDIPALAAGGTVMGSGGWITGEDGPEFNRILPGGGVRVTPLSGAAKGLGASVRGAFTLHNVIELDGDIVASNTAKHVEDAEARA